MFLMESIDGVIIPILVLILPMPISVMILYLLLFYNLMDKTVLLNVTVDISMLFNHINITPESL